MASRSTRLSGATKKAAGFGHEHKRHTYSLRHEGAWTHGGEAGWGVASHARSFERPLGHQAARRIG